QHRRRRPQGDDRVRLTRKNARGGRPPLPAPPRLRDAGGAFGASLRAWMQGRAIPGRRTQTPGRSPCFRTLRVSFHGKGRQASPFVGAARWAARARHRLAPTRPGQVSFHPSWCRQAWVTDVWFKGRGPLDRAFAVAIALKGLDGVLEVVGGLLLLAVTPATIDRLTR